MIDHEYFGNVCSGFGAPLICFVCGEHRDAHRKEKEMSTSDAPDWLIELVGNQMRLMSATKKSVADSIWWELQKRELVSFEEAVMIQRNAKDEITRVIPLAT